MTKDELNILYNLCYEIQNEIEHDEMVLEKRKENLNLYKNTLKKLQKEINDEK